MMRVATHRQMRRRSYNPTARRRHGALMQCPCCACQLVRNTVSHRQTQGVTHWTTLPRSLRRRNGSTPAPTRMGRSCLQRGWRFCHRSPSVWVRRIEPQWSGTSSQSLSWCVPDCLVAHLTTATKLTRLCGVCARKKRRPRTPRSTRGRRRKRSTPSPSCTSKPRKRHLPSSASGKQAWRTTAKKWCATRVRRWPAAMLVAVCA